MVMDSEKDMEEFQGREVFVSQLLDWDSLIHHIIIPKEKVEAFKAHCSVSLDGKPHTVTIKIDNEGYKAVALQIELSLATGKIIQLIYSPQLADALKNKFNDLYKRMSRNRERKDVGGIDKTHIYLVKGYSLDVFILYYSIESFCKPNVNSWRKFLNMNHPFVKFQTDISQKQITQRVTSSDIDSTINEIKSDETQIEVISPTEFPVDTEDLLTIHLSEKLPSLTSKKPTKLTFSNKEYPISTWREMMITIAKLVCKNDNGNTLKQLLVNGKGPMGLRNVSADLHAPMQICEGLWIETQYNAKNLISISLRILKTYNFDTSKVLVDIGPIASARLKSADMSSSWQPSADAKPLVTNSDRQFIFELLDVISQGFPRGIIAESLIDLKRLRQKWQDFGKSELSLDDTTITKVIKENALDFGKGRYFSPINLISDEIMKRIIGELMSSFAAGKKAVYFSSLYEKFASEIGNRIYSPEQLHLVLAHTLKDKDGYVFRRDYISNDFNYVPDPLDAIKEFMHETGRCVTLDEIVENVDFPEDLIRSSIARNPDTIFCINRGCFLLAELVSIEQRELFCARQLITDSLKRKVYLPAKKLIVEWLAMCPEICSRNPDFPQKTFWWILKKNLTEYNITENFITAKEIIPPSLGDYLVKCYQNEQVISVRAIREVLGIDFGNVPGQLVAYGEKLFSRFCHIDQDRYVRLDIVDFPVDAVDASLNIVCKSEFMPLQAINDFSFFPHIEGFKWNTYLLQGFVQHFSKCFHYVGDSKALDKCIGAVVRNSSTIENQVQLLALATAYNKNIDLSNEDELLEWLVSVGYLSSHRCKEIKDVMALAQQERRKKEAD